MARTNHAFTIVELLVVITIIVILLALLAPALDQAIYQAELAVCGSHLRAIGTGTTIYAMDNRRYYPNRPAVEFTTERAILLYVGWIPGVPDERAIIRPYIAINATLNDPLTGKIDIEGSDADTEVFSTYGLWYGWRYTNTGGPEKGMKKLGDRFTFTEPGSGSQLPVTTFDVLAGDWDGIYTDNNSLSNHPDHDGLMFNWVLQDQNFVAGPAAKSTWSFWHTLNGVKHSPLDLNFAFTDGAVRRYNDVKWDEGGPTGPADARMTWAPQHIANNTATWRVQLPTR